MSGPGDDDKSVFRIPPDEVPHRPRRPGEDPFEHVMGGPQQRNIQLPRQQRAELLDESRWSRDFDWQEVEILARHMDLSSVPAGEEVFHEGSSGEYMALIARGRVRVIKEDSVGRRRTITTLLPGKTLGEMSLIDTEPRSATIVADTDTLLLVFTRIQFQRLIDTYPGLGVKMLTNLARMMSQRLRRTSGILVEYLED